MKEHITGILFKYYNVSNMGSKNKGWLQIFGAHCLLNFPSRRLYSVPPETTEEPVVVLPTNAPYEVKFSKTTTYHWPNFDLNVTENDDKGFDASQQGPFGFGNAVDLEASKQQVTLDLCDYRIRIWTWTWAWQ